MIRLKIKKTGRAVSDLVYIATFNVYMVYFVSYTSFVDRIPVFGVRVVL